MRFAWFRDNSPDKDSIKMGFNNPLTRMIFWAFNAVFWIFLLPFFTPLEYSTAIVAFGLIIGIMLISNLYANNVLQLEEYGTFPLRIP